ncbi:hypothetical protein DL96DRAFT_1625817 [Flagelloscypha sp. PMI_526]|nr:hypothetical protein DL96DRAFT_1625817 [Flagelloscypha sp. PMI_526]
MPQGLVRRFCRNCFSMFRFLHRSHFHFLLLFLVSSILFPRTHGCYLEHSPAKGRTIQQTSPPFFMSSSCRT